MLNAAKNLIEEGVSSNYIHKDYKLKGHKQVKTTDCPGTKLLKEIESWSHFESGKII